MMCGWLAAMAWTGMVQAQVHLSGLDKGMTGPRAQMAVLGSAHLAKMHGDVQPRALEPLLQRLAAFRPDVITVEQIPGAGCELMAQYPTIYSAEGIATYCDATEKAHAATGLDVPAAIAQVQATLADWPAHPAPSRRRHLAALFLAANDRASALVQWLQLAEAERHAGDGVDAALAALLDELATADDETFSIGAHLAARLGLQRVFPIDDHTGDSIDVDDVQGFATALRQAWAGAKAETQPRRAREKALFKQGDMLALYRYLNRPDVMRTAIEGDFRAALRESSPEHFGQLYVAGWETRNLRMVANIRAAFRERPGARVLAIVGASHKPWFDNLLGLMQGVDVLDVESLLGPSGTHPDRPAPPTSAARGKAS
ncbi:DUF5694 domain-containing protein [Frateuria hangzhouensis]|uniref:DUF5694 domain-containing protein n=1 Tax=Frateuria hangzhouensis TaxID=2995589 RepID=UPI003CCC637A